MLAVRKRALLVVRASPLHKKLAHLCFVVTTLLMWHERSDFLVRVLHAHRLRTATSISTAKATAVASMAPEVRCSATSVCTAIGQVLRLLETILRVHLVHIARVVLAIKVLRPIML